MATQNKSLAKVTLLLTGMLTMLTIVLSPALPKIAERFKDFTPTDFWFFHIDISFLTHQLITLPALMILLFSPIAGYIADKLGRVKPMLFYILLYAIAGSLGFFLDDIYTILISRAIFGVAVAGMITTTTTLVGDYYTGDERNKFVGMQGAFTGMGRIIFMPIAGLLADASWHYPFLIHLLAIVVLVMAWKSLYEPNHETRTAAADTKTSYSKSLVFLIYITAGIGMMFFIMSPTLLPDLINQLPGMVKGKSGMQIGLAMSSATVTTAIMAMSFKKMRQKFSFPMIYFFTFALMGLGYVIIANSSTFGGYIMGLMVSGLGVGLYMPSSSIWIIEIAPESIRGRLSGQLTTAMYLGYFACPFFTNPLIKLFDSVHATFLTAAIMMMVIAVSFLVGDKIKKA